MQATRRRAIFSRLLIAANEDRNARTVEFDRVAYRDRNLVARRIDWLKESRCVSLASKRRPFNFFAMVKGVCLKRYPRLITPS
jgi:hypothetical protein